MNTPSRRAFPQFLRFVGSHPEPGRVAEAVTRGPLAAVHAKSTVIWQVIDSTHLHMVGSFGTAAKSEVRFSRVPLSLSFPACDAVLDQRVLVQSWLQLSQTYPVLLLDGDVWERNREQAPNGGMITAPIVSGTSCIGAWGTHVTALPDRSARTDEVVQSVTAALSLWLAHPHTPLVDLPSAGVDEEPVALTPRQCHLLVLVLDGLTNAEIAERLHTSRSTVKQDLQRATRSMRASDRFVAASRAQELGLLAGTTPAEALA